MPTNPLLRFAAITLCAVALLVCRPAAASMTLGTQPLYLGGNIPPIVMLTVPKDHQLFKKAYDDFSDLDSGLTGGDTAIETTYKHSIDYYGYFDPYKCYDYITGSTRFEASANTTNKKCTSKWSGNFLNWATMARIDILRKLFYGGYRSTDITGTTVLERALVPVDGHSWAKYFKGDSASTTTTALISEVTPFSSTQALNYSSAAAGAGARQHAATTTSMSVVSTGTVTFTSVSNLNSLVHPLVYGDQVTVCQTTNPTTVCMYGRVNTLNAAANFGATATINVAISGSIGSGSGITAWTITNLSSLGITICNATQATTGNSNDSTATPLMRVAAGDYSLWNVADVGQACRWSDEISGYTPATDFSNATGQSGNNYFFSEITANLTSPVRSASAPSMHMNVTTTPTAAVNGDYVVRVLACPSSPLTLIGTERCTQYPNGNWKPTGLLHDYAGGLQHKIKFGLMTGSYAKNKSGGVLRKNPAFLDSASTSLPSNYDATQDEIDPNTGIYNTTSTTPGIIRTLNGLRLYGWGFAAGSGNYGGGGTILDNCNSPGTPAFTEGDCSSWGNPISEMYMETLRYLAGKAAATSGTNQMTYTQTGSKDAGLSPPSGLSAGLLQPTWANPMTSSTYCTPLHIIAINSSVNSYDDDQYPTDLFTGSNTAQTYTKTVGDYESITGNSYLIGNNGITNNGVCTSKTISDFGLATGICPEAPATLGSFKIAGLAYWAKTNKIRSDFTVPTTDTRSLKVTTYGIALATGAPSIQIPVPSSSPTRYITILPASRSFNPALFDRGGGQIMDFKVIRQDLTAGTGKFYVAWDNAQQGSDYDLDVWGTISYAFSASNTRITVTTNTISGAAGSSTLFGYVISGTSSVTGSSIGAQTSYTSASGDGMHFHSGFKGSTGIVISYNFPGTFSSATSGNNECNDCTIAATPTATSVTYAVSASTSATTLKDPLWYASKYGGFSDQNSNSRPDLTQEWDSKINVSGADGTDGNPDTYFPVTSPAGLETALDRAFISVLQTSSASSVATNSTSLQSGSVVYQARFNSNEWSGQLLAFSISTTGAIDPVPLWDAGQLVPTSTARTIITYNRSTVSPGQAASSTNKGIPFRWANVSTNSTYLSNLNTNSTGTADTGTVQCTAVSAGTFTPTGCTLMGSVRLDWLRGDQSNEGAVSTSYRVRPTSVLGDIVNSTPGYVGSPSSLQYGDFSPPSVLYTAASYTTFASTYASRTAMIYAGGNDGMLHGFDASTGSSKGIEKLAYVPSMAYKNLTKLTDRTYSSAHTYFVDGTPTVGDVYIDKGDGLGSRWRTILVGGLNAGGQGVYALDVTDPAGSVTAGDGFSESNANNLVLWEWNDYNDNWLGYTYSQPTIAKMANGKWAVIFGNGYNNNAATDTADTQLGTGCATLYILFIEGGIDGVWTAGTDFRFIDAGSASCGTSIGSGLSTPRVVTDSSTGVAKYIYAGDLTGRLWKYDVSSPGSGSWALSNGSTPFFYAADYSSPATSASVPSHYATISAAQPITAAPTSVAHTSGTGTMILFGTGKYLEQQDDSSTWSNATPTGSAPFTTQSFYGIWDKNDGSVVTGRWQLMQQRVLGTSSTNRLGTTVDDAATTTVDESGFRITTPYTPNYTNANRFNNPGTFGITVSTAVDEIAITPPQRGWFLDFPYSGDYSSSSLPITASNFVVGTGERSVFRPILSNGKLVFTTLVPTNASCEAGGTSFIMDMDPQYGSRLSNSPFDVNGDTNFSSADYVKDPSGTAVAVSGKASSIGLVPTPTVIQMTPAAAGSVGKEVKVLSGSTGQLISVLELGGAATLPGAVGRRVTWRELQND